MLIADLQRQVFGSSGKRLCFFNHKKEIKTHTHTHGGQHGQ